MNYRSLLSALTLLGAAFILLIITGIYGYQEYQKQQAAALVPSQTTVVSPKPAPVAMDSLSLAGKALFTGNCASCHALTDEVIMGPGLRGITQRRSEE